MLDWIKTKTGKNRRDFGKYNFYVKHEPSAIDSSTTLTLTTYTSQSEEATIPCRYKWSILKNGLTIQVPEFKGSCFKCEPSDVGSIVQAEVFSTDPEFSGTAVIHFGPVKLDFAIKKQIESALSSGCATMPINIVSGTEEKECQIRLYEDVMKINHAYSEVNYTFDYSIFEPRVECVSKDSSRLVIIFSEKYEAELKRFTKRLFEDSFSSNSSKDLSSSSRKSPPSLSYQKLEIKFMNRTSRDIFLFTMKAYNTKKELRSSVILNKVEKIDFSNQETFDFALQIEGLKSELVKMDWVLKKTQTEKHRYWDEVQKLEKEIEEIIVTYTRIVEEKFQSNQELSRDYSVLSNKRDEVIGRKYRALENENNHLNSRIQSLAQEIDAIRFKPSQDSQPAQTQLQPQYQPLPNKNLPNHMIASGQNGQPQYQPVTQQFYQSNASSNVGGSPFIKKVHNEGDNTGLANLLDELGESRVSYINHLEDANFKGAPDSEEYELLKNNLQKIEYEKQQLQKNLDKSFSRIDKLEKELYEKEKALNQPQGINKLSASSVHFSYKGQETLVPQQVVGVSAVHPGSVSAVYDSERERVFEQNQQLRKTNEQLMREKKNLAEELRKSTVRANNSSGEEPTKGDGYINTNSNSLNFLKTHKKESATFQASKNEADKDLYDIIGRKEARIKLLTMENEELKKENEKIKAEALQLRERKQSANISQHSEQRLVRKIKDLQEQIEMYRKNSDALNRSQQLSMEMDSYNDEQINMLKQHNQFLTTENEKLAKGCEKYMSEAKEANKLRMEIIRLKEKINELQALNNSLMV